MADGEGRSSPVGSGELRGPLSREGTGVEAQVGRSGVRSRVLRQKRRKKWEGTKISAHPLALVN